MILWWCSWAKYFHCYNSQLILWIHLLLFWLSAAIALSFQSKSFLMSWPFNFFPNCTHFYFYSSLIFLTYLILLLSLLTIFSMFIFHFHILLSFLLTILPFSFLFPFNHLFLVISVIFEIMIASVIILEYDILKLENTL